MEIIVQKFRSFGQAERADREYYRSLSCNQRIEPLLQIVQQARTHATAEGFERVYRIVKLPRR